MRQHTTKDTQLLSKAWARSLIAALRTAKLMLWP
jgi:hypothetical protein